jgi:hypothetical protein
MGSVLFPQALVVSVWTAAAASLINYVRKKIQIQAVGKETEYSLSAHLLEIESKVILIYPAAGNFS